MSNIDKERERMATLSKERGRMATLTREREELGIVDQGEGGVRHR